MTTPWEHINEEYRTYLEETGLSKEDFNAATPAERMSWRKQQQQQQPNAYLQGHGQKKRFCVSGTIERSVSSAGDRFQLVQLARGGYYRHNEGIEQGFQCLAHPEENKDNLRLISVGVVFKEEAQANNFAAAVHSYVAKTPGVHLHQGQSFQISAMDPFEPERLVFETDYVPREKDGEVPLDSPVWGVEINSMDQSAVTSYYSREDTM